MIKSKTIHNYALRTKPNKPTIGEIKPPYGPIPPPAVAPPNVPTFERSNVPTLEALELAHLIETMPAGSGLQHNPDGSSVKWVYMTHIQMYGRPRPRTFYADTPLDALRQAVIEQEWPDSDCKKAFLQ